MWNCLVILLRMLQKKFLSLRGPRTRYIMHSILFVSKYFSYPTVSSTFVYLKHSKHFFEVGDISPGTPVPQFHVQGAPGTAGDTYGVGQAAGPAGPQGYGNGTNQFGAAGVGAQPAGQWNNNFGWLWEKTDFAVQDSM